MTTLTEGQHAGEFLVSQPADPSVTREVATVLSGQSLDAGEVVGKVLYAQAAAPVPAVVGTGNGVMTLVRPGKLAQVGTYVVTCTAAVTNGGTFSVVAPDGTILPSLTLTAGAGVATAYKSEHIDFTITDGSTDFAEGDVFSIVITAAGTPAVVGTGNGVLSALSLGRDAKPGSYVLTCTAAVTHGGTFSVTDPDGNRLPDLVMTAGAGVATAYATEQINLTVTDGSTDFAAGDVFCVPVARSASYGKLVEWDPTTFDGRHRAAGILYDAVDASSADTAGVLVARGPVEINESELQWAAARTSAEKAYAMEQLAALGVAAR
jgi:Bacteriophage lambda head decoration protein D